jgi:hypothetical protein
MRLGLLKSGPTQWWLTTVRPDTPTSRAVINVSTKADNRIPRWRVKVYTWTFSSFASDLTATTSYLRFDKLLIGQLSNHGTKNVQRSIVCMVQTFTANVVTLQTALLRDYRRTTAVLQ